MDGFKPALKKIPASSAFDVVIDRIGGIEVLHDSGEIGLGGFQKQVIMVTHEAISVQVQFESFFSCFEVFKKLSVVGFIEEYLLMVIAARGYMIKTIPGLQSVRTGHKTIGQQKP